ncbi:MAG: cupin domain-containing protein [Nitrospirae bacterium]|nr:cupin domain-containing protein [Nitrospirota bacterium]
MDIKTVADLATYSSEKMKKVGLFSTARVANDLYCLEPGQAQKAHAHDGEDKVYYVLEGAGTVVVGNEESAIAAGQIVIAPAGVSHGITNGASGRMKVLVFMAPNAHFEGGHGHKHGAGCDHGHGHGHGHGHRH